MNGMWGLLGPEFLQSARRTRTLGLNASVRRFNDLAVPGLGGVWFGKQLLLATLGIYVAEKARSSGSVVQNIEMANATEALACWLAFEDNDWNRDSRLRGSTKLHGKDFSCFQRVRQRNFYVTQPMRMATVQALPALGLVDSDSSRFNAFQCLEAGRNFVETALDGFRPGNRTVVDHLTCWAQRKDVGVSSDKLREALSPLTPLPAKAIPILRERLIQGGLETTEEKARRCNALAWAEALRRNPDTHAAWSEKPPEITQDHWHDLRAGALFFGTRDAALKVLDVAEAHIGNQAQGQRLPLKGKLPDALIGPLETLKAAAKQYLDFTEMDKPAAEFCHESIHREPAEVLRALVSRDGQVLRMNGDEIRPGPAFRESPGLAESEGEDPEIPQAENNLFPSDVSYRMQNLFLLNLDMHHELDGWLQPQPSGDAA